MSKTYYWHNKRATFSRGKGKPPVGFGDEMPSISPAQEKLFLDKGWISTEKTVTERQLSELEQLREQVKELKKGGDSAEVEKLKAELAESESEREELAEELAELKEKKPTDESELSEMVESIKGLLKNTQQGDSKAEIWEAVKLVKETLEQV